MKIYADKTPVVKQRATVQGRMPKKKSIEGAFQHPGNHDFSARQPTMFPAPAPPKDADIRRLPAAFSRVHGDFGPHPGIYPGGVAQGAPVAQCYHELGKGSIWGYGKGAGVNAPNFEFQKTRALKTLDEDNSTATYGISADQVIEDAPTLRVSDNNDLAVPISGGGEAKRFFATPAKILQSNAQLALLGAPLRLIQGAGQITLPAGWNPFGPTLNEVRPNLAGVVNASSECGAFAQNILGVDIGAIELQTLGGPQRVALAPGMGRDASVNTALNGRDPETLGANRRTDPGIGEAFGILARRNAPPEALTTRLWNSITTMNGLLAKNKPHMQWGEHWAGVVAKSGGDSVTLENYNRVAADTDLIMEMLENDYKELKGLDYIHEFVQRTADYESPPGESGWRRLARLGRNYMNYAAKTGAVVGHYQNQLDRWYFAMYGSEDKSFHEQWKDAAPNAVTAKVVR